MQLMSAGGGSCRSASVHGFEIQADALKAARERVAEEGLSNVTLHHLGWSNVNQVHSPHSSAYRTIRSRRVS